MALTASELTRLEVLEENQGANSLIKAIAEGESIYGMTGGFFDVFTDETDVNTGSSTGERYDSTNDYYRSALEVVDGGTAFYDASSNGYSIDVTGTSQTKIPVSDDPYGGNNPTLLLDGNSDYVSSTPANFAFSGEFLIDGQFKTSSASGFETIVCEWGQSGNYSYLLWINNSGYAQFYYSANGTSFANIVGSTDWRDGNWHHIAVSRDSSNVMKLVVDGILQASVTYSSTFYSSALVLRIGATAAATPGDYFDGELSDKR